MIQYNTLNVKTCNKKRNWSNFLNFSSHLIGNFSYETNFPHKLLLTDTQVSKIRKAFANGSLSYTNF